MKKILIIDDNNYLSTYLARQLTKAGHEVVTESSGLSAIQLLSEYKPDVILLDYFLPNINGDKLCKIIRKMNHLKQSQLFLMSAAASEMQLDPAKTVADAVIAKGTFKETADHLFSLLGIEESPQTDTPPKGIIGIESVLPRRMTIELLGKNHHLQTVLDSISEGILEIHRDQIVYANPAASTILGQPQDQLLAVFPPDLFPPSEKPKIEFLLSPGYASSNPNNRETLVKLRNKILLPKKLPLPDDPDTVLLMLSDITEQKRTEEALHNYQVHLEKIVEERTADLKRTQEKLQQAQKMEAIGILAGGVAHDLNNILTAVVGYPELMLMKMPPDSPLRKITLSIQESGQKAAAIVQDLLTMARRGVSISAVVNLNTIVSDYLKSPEYDKLRSFHTKVYFETVLDENLPNILGSPVHLSKTVMNLVSNASEAMPEGGTVLISTEMRRLDRAIKIMGGTEEVTEGDYVVLTVADSGVGISADDLEKIFDPFYTKKMMGRSGTGLGMTVVWGTVKDHKGFIEIQSTVGRGTSFILYFPITSQELAKGKILTSMNDFRGRGESILVVDDDAEQRQMISMALTTLGYTVSTVASGEKAVEFIEQAHVDLIILDINMDPGIDGLETYRRISKIHPGQKAIVASGYSEIQSIAVCLSFGIGQYIEKPYSLEKIGRAVRSELDKR